MTTLAVLLPLLEFPYLLLLLLLLLTLEQQTTIQLSYSHRSMRSWSLSHFLLLAVGYRLVVALYLELVSSVLPLFDPTPADFLPSTSWLQPFVRWDVLWFLPVALRGSYKHEQETAFGWGWVGTMRALGRVVNWLQGKDELDAADLVLGGVVGSWLAGLGATAALY